MKFIKPRKNIRTSDSGSFVEFFLHASESKKKEVLRKAAHRANLEQRAVFKRAKMKIKTK